MGGTSRCFSLGAEQFAFFGSFLFPFSVGESAATLLLAPTPLPQHLQHITPLLFFPLPFPFFFFFAPPLLLSLSFRPLDVCKAQLCWPSTLCVSLARRLLSFIHPSPPPNYQPTRLPAPRLLEVTWDRIDRRLITFDRIDFFAAWFSCLFQ